MAEMLLLSNSTAPGRGFLEPALGVIAEVMHGRRRLLFVALASSDPVRYTQMMRGCLAQIGIRVEGADAAGSLRRASAGANLACPTIRTTNDMPIVDPGSFRALGLIPFHVNAHYPYDEPAGSPAGETRQQRIAEFLEENDVPVLGLREGTWLRVSGEMAILGGAAGCRLFRRGAGTQELPAGSDVSARSACPSRSTPGSRPARARPAARIRDSDGPTIRLHVDRTRQVVLHRPPDPVAG
jgi:dipeptidase E